MHRFPRQASSGGAAPSSSDATAPSTSSGSIDGTGSQTSGLTTATDVTSGLLSSSTTPASSSSSADLTTSSSSTETTSTSSPTSTSPSSTSVPSTTSQTPTSSPTSSSSSIASQTTSSAFSSVSISSTTTVPPPSSSLQGTLTTITSAYTTYVNGSQILTSTTIPSTIPEPSTASSSSNRTAIIAGSAAGGTALIILILSLAFCTRRKRFKRLDFLDAITLKRKQARSRATLLDGEDLSVGLPPVRYTDYETPWDGRLPVARERGTPGTSASRWSESGSAFREDVWPPPNEDTRLMDPLANRDDHHDLGRIVDDVMGPSPTARHYSDQSVSSMYRGSVAESGRVHSRTASNASNAALLEAAGLGSPAGTGAISTAPVRPSPLAQQGTKPDSVGHQASS